MLTSTVLARVDVRTGVGHLSRRKALHTGSERPYGFPDLADVVGRRALLLTVHIRQGRALKGTCVNFVISGALKFYTRVDGPLCYESVLSYLIAGFRSEFDVISSG